MIGNGDRTVENESEEKIASLLARVHNSPMLTSDRYAENEEDQSLYMQFPEGLYKIGQCRVVLTLYINVYGNHEERVTAQYVPYVDRRDGGTPPSGMQIPMYSAKNIVRAGLNPIHPMDLPHLYRVTETFVTYHTYEEAE